MIERIPPQSATSSETRILDKDMADEYMEKVGKGIVRKMANGQVAITAYKEDWDRWVA